MFQLTVGGLLCVIAACFLLAVVFICAIFTRIAASQENSIGCFVLAGIFCCLVAALVLGLGFT